MSAVQRRMFIVLFTAVLVVILFFIIILAEKQEEMYLPLRKCRNNNVPVRREQCSSTSKCHPPFEHLTNYAKLPPEAVEKLRYFVLFAGHARSGSSIVGAVIDAHPHAVLANEYFFPRWMALTPELFPNRSFVFSQLYARQQRIVAHDRKTELKGYSLYIKGSHMGSYDRWVNVIGDKSGAYTTYMYMKDPDRFMEILQDIRTLVGVPIKFIQVSMSQDLVLIYNSWLRHEHKSSMTYKIPRVSLWCKSYFPSIHVQTSIASVASALYIYYT